MRLIISEEVLPLPGEPLAASLTEPIYHLIESWYCLGVILAASFSVSVSVSEDCYFSYNYIVFSWEFAPFGPIFDWVTLNLRLFKLLN